MKSLLWKHKNIDERQFSIIISKPCRCLVGLTSNLKTSNISSQTFKQDYEKHLYLLLTLSLSFSYAELPSHLVQKVQFLWDNLRKLSELFVSLKLLTHLSDCKFYDFWKVAIYLSCIFFFKSMELLVSMVSFLVTLYFTE